MSADRSGPVIEFVTFTVAPEDHAGWLEADERVWTAFLREQAGFVSKQTWIDRSNPELIHAAVRWVDEATWKSIPDDVLAAVDEEFGDWRRPLTMQIFDVVE
ncbi:MAG: TIGR03792 family protein [Ilumatobacter sp.]